MASSHIHLLINVGSRRSRDALPTIESQLAANRIDVDEIHRLQPGDDLGDMITDIKASGAQVLIVGGGDGTVSDVVDHLVDSDIELGIIPLGTTNNFARSLNLPLDMVEAISVITKAKARPVDLGKTGDDYFANVIGIGISALIAQHVTNAAKKRYGRLAYAIVGLQQLLRHKPFVVTLRDKDSELQVNFETHQLIIANGRYHAGKQIAVDAKLDNRELVIFALGGRRKLSFIWHTLDYYVGRRKQVAHTSYLSGKSIKLTTDTPQQVELDGEAKYQTPLAIEVKPQAIKVRH